MTDDDHPGLRLLGTRLRKVRETRNLSQEELAALSKVSQGTISLVEADRRLPSVENLAKLAVALKVSADFLIGLRQEVDDPGPDEVNSFFRHAGEINAEDRRLALDIIGVIKKRRR